MTFQVNIGFNPEALSAIADLAAAIRSISGAGSIKAPATAATSASTADKPKATETKETADEPSTIYWFSSASKEFGTVDSQKAFDALKKKDAKVVKWTEEKYNKAVADKAAADEAAAAGGSEDDDVELPTEQDVIDAFGAYLPADLDKSERAERAAFVKPMLARFGAKKASELPEEHRRLAINLVQRKAAGQDVDPETDEFEEFDAEESLV